MSNAKMGRRYPPLLLRHTRVERTYTGGLLMDRWQGIEPAEDGRKPESWIASTISSRYAADPDAGLSVVAGPAFEGMKLRDLIAADPEALLGGGHAAVYGSELGFMTKIIDSDKRLNVQTHPNRAKAKELFDSEFGKTEAWYVLDTRAIDGAEPFVLLGFKPGISRAEWESVVESQDKEAIAERLHRLPARPGDVFLVESGVPHAIGSGCLIAEIQEPTDITFRVERMVGPDGPYPDEVYHQGIGFDRMFDCFDYRGVDREEIEARTRRIPRPRERGPGFVLETLIGPEDTRYFGLDRLMAKGEYDLRLGSSFASAVVLSGKGEIRSHEGCVQLAPSAELFLPHSETPYRVRSAGDEELVLLVCRPPLD